MSKEQLFSQFQPVSTKHWKQQIQFDLKGADYNGTLVWESPEGIKVKPFYNSDDVQNIDLQQVVIKSGFQILQNIYVHDVSKSNNRAFDTLNRGAESICFTIPNQQISIDELMQNLPTKASYYFKLHFLSTEFNSKLNQLATKNQYHFYILNDPIYQLTSDGNWFENQDKDFEKLNIIVSNSAVSCISVNGTQYQNAGANVVQQLAYILSHCNEYFNHISKLNQNITIEIAVGTNYFFEIAKIRALRMLFNSLAKKFDHNLECHIIATPTKRNKTIYDYNTNLLRTTTECMAAILGGADAISNVAYDNLYHKDNEFGDRIARNQLLILKEESYFDKVSNPADGTYYIESLTNQLAEKALILFKEIESKGGFLAQLLKGNIQKKIVESAKKEQELFDLGKEVLIGTNKHPNKNDKMKNDLELYPFVKHNPRKTTIVPIIESRLAEKTEQERLKLEK